MQNSYMCEVIRVCAERVCAERGPALRLPFQTDESRNLFAVYLLHIQVKGDFYFVTTKRGAT